MEFKPASTTMNYPTLRLVSEGGSWEVGIWPVIFGLRVRAGRTDNTVSVAVDYCAGNDEVFCFHLLATMVKILERGVSITHRELERILPTWEVRPINQDPCWGKLQQLANELDRDS